MKIKAIITGVTGMVGEGVLYECLQHTEVEEVLVINRHPCGVSHPKLKEIIHQNFLDFSPIKDKLVGYNACYFCLGVTSVGKNEETYRKLTYDLTLHVAKTLSDLNPEMVFCYVSGAGTRSDEGGSMWARVKGKTENDLLKLPFKSAFMYRPGFINPTKGLKNAHKAYYAFTWLYPLLRKIFPNFVCTLKELGLSMINVTLNGYNKSVLEVRDIVISSKK